jgi:hypothetical protein
MSIPDFINFLITSVYSYILFSYVYCYENTNKTLLKHCTSVPWNAVNIFWRKFVYFTVHFLLGTRTYNFRIIQTPNHKRMNLQGDYLYLSNINIPVSFHTNQNSMVYGYNTFN